MRVSSACPSYLLIGRVGTVLSESLHALTEAVLLFAARLTVDHQVRHLHSNLGLFLNFLLLPDLRLDRKKQPLPVYTCCGRLVYELPAAHVAYMYVPPRFTVARIGVSPRADLPRAPCCTADSRLAG